VRLDNLSSHDFEWKLGCTSQTYYRHYDDDNNRPNDLDLNLSDQRFWLSYGILRMQRILSRRMLPDWT